MTAITSFVPLIRVLLINGIEREDRIRNFNTRMNNGILNYTCHSADTRANLVNKIAFLDFKSTFPY